MLSVERLKDGQVNPQPSTLSHNRNDIFLMLHILFSIVILIGITSCSTFQDKESEDLLTRNDRDELRIERPLCKYIEVKGISELVNTVAISNKLISNNFFITHFI